MDALVATVGLLLLANLIGLLLGLWACFAKFKVPVPILPTRSCIIDSMDRLSSFSGAARGLPTALSLLLLKARKAVVAPSSLVLQSSNIKGPAALDQTLVTSPPLFSVCLCLTGSTV